MTWDLINNVRYSAIIMLFDVSLLVNPIGNIVSLVVKVNHHEYGYTNENTN